MSFIFFSPRYLFLSFYLSLFLSPSIFLSFLLSLSHSLLLLLENRHSLQYSLSVVWEKMETIDAISPNPSLTLKALLTIQDIRWQQRESVVTVPEYRVAANMRAGRCAWIPQMALESRLTYNQRSRQKSNFLPEHG